MAAEKAEDGPRLYYSSTVPQAERMLDYTLRRDATVKFLLGALARQGCTLRENFFSVKECSEEASGGFLPGEGVVVCANHVGMQDEVNTIVAHELVHAYDHCRARNMDWSDLRHHACSEIRAANLSGQCHMNRELLLLGPSFRFQEGHKACVRRKAQLSVAMNPSAWQPHGHSADSIDSCGTQAHSGQASDASEGVQAAAAAAVEAVWAQCYADTAPFTGVP